MLEKIYTVELFEQIPESGPIYVMGQLEPVVQLNDGRNRCDCNFVLQDIKLWEPAKSVPSSKVEKPAA